MSWNWLEINLGKTNVRVAHFSCVLMYSSERHPGDASPLKASVATMTAHYIIKCNREDCRYLPTTYCFHEDWNLRGAQRPFIAFQLFRAKEDGFDGLSIYLPVIVWKDKASYPNIKETRYAWKFCNDREMGRIVTRIWSNKLKMIGLHRDFKLCMSQ